MNPDYSLLVRRRNRGTLMNPDYSLLVRRRNRGTLNATSRLPYEDIATDVWAEACARAVIGEWTFKSCYGARTRSRNADFSATPRPWSRQSTTSAEIKTHITLSINRNAKRAHAAQPECTS